MIPLFDELKQLSKNTEGWSVLSDEKKYEVLMETKKSIRGFTILRAKGIINYPAIDVWRAYEHAELQKEFNSNLADSRWLKKIGANAYIGY